MTALMRLLAHALHVANQSPPTLRREEFYALKDRLLQRWGTPDGIDIQHIRKVCYTCDGTGRYEGRVTCRRCCGLGIYAEFWTYLQRYTLGRHSFHIPRQKTYRCPDELVTIEGYIQHDHPGGHRAAEWSYWLFLFFDLPTFLRSFGRVGGHHRPRTPLVTLSSLLFRLRRIPQRMQERIDWRRWERFNREQRMHYSAWEGYDDLPF